MKDQICHFITFFSRGAKFGATTRLLSCDLKVSSFICENNLLQRMQGNTTYNKPKGT